MKRRTFIKRSLVTGALLSVGGITYVSTPNNSQMINRYQSNPQLKTILPNWQGSPVDQEGRFMNHEFSFIQGFGQAFKWMTQSNPQKQFKKQDPWRMPMVKDDTFLSKTEDVVVPLGHASFYIRLGGKSMLIDPVLGSIPSVKRLTELPIRAEKLSNLDYILISHAHYDHCDSDSIKLLQKQNPQTVFLTGLGMEGLLRNWLGQQKVQEAGWYQQYQTEDLTITYLPSRHWSNRHLWDINKRLWGAFVIQGNGKTIYFGGDSGYGSHFKEVGDLFPNIDLALIGAGAYAQCR